MKFCRLLFPLSLYGTASALRTGPKLLDAGKLIEDLKNCHNGTQTREATNNCVNIQNEFKRTLTSEDKVDAAVKTYCEITVNTMLCNLAKSKQTPKPGQAFD